MAITNHERVGKAMDLLRQGLAPFVERELKNVYKEQARAHALRFLGEDRLLADKPIGTWDAAALLKLMWEAWNDVSRRTLGQAERTLLSELRDVRNKWAHQQTFSSDDAYRALDSVGRLLAIVSAPEAQEVEKMKMELLRLRFDEQVRAEKRKTAGTAIEGQAAGNLKPWREVITPHEDVASGRYQQAEFAADLWQVHLGEGADEYRKPVDFFRRTYLTESLKHLLVGAVQRLSGKGGDPVVQLQTMLTAPQIRGNPAVSGCGLAVRRILAIGSGPVRAAAWGSGSRPRSRRISRRDWGSFAARGRAGRGRSCQMPSGWPSRQGRCATSPSRRRVSRARSRAAGLRPRSADMRACP